MIKLHGYGPAWGLPDCNPFVTKVDCYMRMVDLPHTLLTWRSLEDLQTAPEGKFPYVEDNGKKVAGSGSMSTISERPMGKSWGGHAEPPGAGNRA
jgi:Glutathione S-transferase N-terminal domain